MDTNQWPDALEEAEDNLREKLQETLLVQMNEPTVEHLREEVCRLGRFCKMRDFGGGEVLPFFCITHEKFQKFHKSSK